MKNSQLIKPLLIGIMMSIIFNVAKADGFTVGNFQYQINSDGKSVTVFLYPRYSNYNGAISIPSSVTYMDNTYKVTDIGAEAFSGCYGMTSVTIPNTITNICYRAFTGCSGLTSITIPSSVCLIGKEAFNSANLTTVYWNVIECNDFTYSSSPFSNNLNTIYFGENVVKVPAYLCYQRTNLTSLSLPNSVSTIGDYAFEGCTSLSTLNIPSSLTSIGTYAFSGCNGLTAITVDDGNPNYNSKDNCNAIIRTNTNALIVGCRNTIIPNSVTMIDDRSFYNCTGLTSINIPYSVTTIGYEAFYNCTGLNSFSIPESVTSIGAYAFCYCSGLTTVNLPNITNLGGCAFMHCNSLKSVDVGYSLTSINNATFCDCTGLTSVNIGNSVTAIGYEAFGNCTGLTSFVIPESVKSIGAYAFSECSNLTSVTIGKSVTDISYYAFSHCNKLRNIYSKIMNPENTTCGNDVFEGVSKNYCKLYVPQGTSELYQFTAPWNEFLNIIEEGGNGQTNIKGDVNGDGVVTAADVTAIYDILLGVE